MKKLFFVLSGVLLIGAVAVFITTGSSTEQSTDPSTLVVYKSPTCACCGKWVEHMETAGFDVEVREVDDVNAVKEENGVGYRLASCHTALIDGYVIEGHVPARDVEKLLAERPEILGLAVPGMPMGSPGMEMPNPARHQDFQVMAFDGEGRSAVYREVEAESTP